MTTPQRTKTQILVTIGPATEEPSKLKWFITNGVRLFRLNFKHNTVEWHRSVALRIRRLAKRLNKDVTIILDLQGPSVRFVLDSDTLSIVQGQPVRLVEKITSPNQISLTYPYLIGLLQDGMFVYAGDGELVFKVVRDGNTVRLLPLISGTLRNKVAFNVQDLDIHGLPVLTERDEQGFVLISEGLIDVVALSFVNNALQVRQSKKMIYQHTGKDIPVISKLETRAAFYNLDEILDVSEAIMVARGDLALQTPFFKLTYYQKEMIKRARSKAVPVIVATQMLQSMVTNPFPTRAEISDVANSVLDGPDAIMLSGETAMGKFPIRTVQLMQRIVAFYEKQEDHARLTQPALVSRKEFVLGGDLAAVSGALYNWARYPEESNIAFIVVFSDSLKVLDSITSLRLKTPVVLVTYRHGLEALAQLRFGVFGTFMLTQAEYKQSTSKRESLVLDKLVRLGVVKPRQKVIFVSSGLLDGHRSHWIHMVQV